MTDNDAAEATASIAGPPGAPPARVTLRPRRGGDLQVLRAAAEKCDVFESLQDSDAEGEVLPIALDFEPAPLRCAAERIDELHLAAAVRIGKIRGSRPHNTAFVAACDGLPKHASALEDRRKFHLAGGEAGARRRKRARRASSSRTQGLMTAATKARRLP